METDYKSKRYNENRAILKGLCEQLGVSTTTYVPRPSSAQATQRKPISAARPVPITTNKAPVKKQEMPVSRFDSSSSNSTELRSIIIIVGTAIIMWLIVLLCCIYN